MTPLTYFRATSDIQRATFQVLLDKLGIQCSYSRPRVSNDNAFSEALFRTLKYRPEYPYKGFETIEDAQSWEKEFVHWYNCIHLHSGLNFVTPEQCHKGEHIDVLKKRQGVYELAKAKHPERWARSTRDWSPQKPVALNPMKEIEIKWNNKGAEEVSILPQTFLFKNRMYSVFNEKVSKRSAVAAQSFY